MTKKWTTLPFLVIEDDIAWLVIKWSTDWLLPMEVIKGIMGTSVEGVVVLLYQQVCYTVICHCLPVSLPAVSWVQNNHAHAL